MLKRSKERHHNLMFMFMAAMLLMINTIVLFPKDIQADVGPKPSIEITVKNGPKDYYIALIEKKKGLEGRSALKLDNVTDESVEAFLKNFAYDGWGYFENPVGTNYKRANEGGVFHFGYMTPDYFRVMIIDMDGNVLVSDAIEKIEFNAEFSFDYAAGELKELRTEVLLRRIGNVTVNYILTLVIEFIILLAFAYPVKARNIIWFITVNAATNIPLNLYFSYEQNKGPEYFMQFMILEGLIMIVEAVIYRFTLVNKEGKKGNKAIVYGIVANLVSATIGFFLPTYLW